MELIKDTPLEVAWRVWQARPPQPSLTVAVKGTFDIPESGVCALADEQALVTGDEHHDDDVARSLRYASDLELLKPRGECLVVGNFHAPGGQPVRHSKIAFKIGSVGKQLALIGDRAWIRGNPSEPKPFKTMPLAWENAFGGRGVAENPVGRGIESVEVDGDERVLLPNIEDPERLVLSRDMRPRPVGCGPIPRTWAHRTKLAGTYDARWRESRYPWFPADIDWSCFNAAPVDQQIEGYWRGDEEITLRHLHPDHPRVQCRLPGIRANAFLALEGDDRLLDVGLALDTIIVDADAGLAYCVWRGVTEVRREDLRGVRHLFVAHEEADERLRLDDYAHRYRLQLEQKIAEAIAEEPAPLPRTSSLVRREALLAAMGSDQPGAKWAHLDQALTMRGDESALQAALQHAADDKQGALALIFDNAIGARPKSEERELSPEELLELEMQLALGDLLGEKGEDLGRRAVREAIANGETDLRGRDLRGADLSELDLGDLDFTGAILVRANLSGARATGCRFDGATLFEAELSLASFDRCVFEDAEMSSARAHRARFHECEFEHAHAAQSYLREARFAACRLARSEFAHSDLGEAEFRDCNLDEADLSRAILERTSFHRSSLADTWMEGVTAPGMKLDGCHAPLLRASEEANLEGASFKKAMLEGARFGRARLRGANFSLAQLSRADFSQAFLMEATLTACDLRSSRFDGASMVKASLLRSNLMQARLEGANLSHADLRGANLFQAELYLARLTDARMDLANLTGTRIG